MQIAKFMWIYVFEIILTIVKIVPDDRRKNRLVEIRLKARCAIPIL